MNLTFKMVICVFTFCCFCLWSETADGQTIKRRYDFDSNLTLGAPTVTSPNAQSFLQSGNVTGTTVPAAATFGVISATNTTDINNNSTTSSARAMRASTNGTDGTVTITFPAIPPSNFTGTNDLFISFRNNAIGIGAGQGLDASDDITVSVSLNNGTTFSDEARITGNNQATWNYNVNNAVIANYDGDNSVEAAKVFRPATAGSTNDPTAPTKFTIRIPDANLAGSTGVVFRVTLVSNRTDEQWGVDDFIAYTAAPTASSVNLSGRVLTPFGRGLSRATVSIAGSSGDMFYALTNQFGYYRFTDVQAGETYILDVKSKGYIFSPQIVFALEDDDQLNFSAISSILPKRLSPDKFLQDR